MRRGDKIAAGVNFQPAILRFLDELRADPDEPLFSRRSRSEALNIIVEEYARATGRTIKENPNPKSA